jgi:hydrogenase-4 membrane subunit HyfE
MTEPNMALSALTKLDALAGGLFLLTALGLVAMRQVLASLNLFVLQSVLLAASAFILGYQHASIHLYVVAGITLTTKSALIPWLLRRTISQEIYARREISQVLNIPTSLLLSVALMILAYFIASPLLSLGQEPFIKVNLPIGLAGLLLGAYMVMVRREVVPQVIGILAMENGAFFAGVAIAPDLPLIAELAAAFDVLIIALVMGLLTRRIHERVGTTAVGRMTSLKEE